MSQEEASLAYSPIRQETTAPSAEELWRISEDLNAVKLASFTSQFFPRTRLELLAPRLLRDFGVATITTLLLTAGYLNAHDFPINPWSTTFNAMDIRVENTVQGYGKLQINKTVENVPVLVSGKHYPKALGTHAHSVISIKLTREGRFFDGACGYPDSVWSASIKCSIEGDGRVIWTSGVLDHTKRLEAFRLELSGFNDFKLVVQSQKPGIDAAHAVWVDLKVTNE